jgi:putative superfamily III holin-X
MVLVKSDRWIPEIFADLVNQFTALVRKEAQLARAEMSEKIGAGLGLVGGGAVLLVPALVVLLQAGRLLPRKTIEQLQLDAAVAMHQTRSDHGISKRAA